MFWPDGDKGDDHVHNFFENQATLSDIFGVFVFSTPLESFKVTWCISKASVERNDMNTGGKMRLRDAFEVDDVLPQSCIWMMRIRVNDALGWGIQAHRSTKETTMARLMGLVWNF